VDGFYDVLKGRAYSIATIATGRSNADAQASGFKDVYDLLMSDSDHSRQAAFLTLLTDDVMPESHRKILLDGHGERICGPRRLVAVCGKRDKLGKGSSRR